MVSSTYKDKVSTPYFVAHHLITFSITSPWIYLCGIMSSRGPRYFEVNGKLKFVSVHMALVNFVTLKYTWSHTCLQATMTYFPTYQSACSIEHFWHQGTLVESSSCFKKMLIWELPTITPTSRGYWKVIWTLT